MSGKKPSRIHKKVQKAKLKANKTAGDDRTVLLVQAVDGIRDYGIFTLDTEGNILTWNQGAERLKGYSPKEAIGMNFSAFYTAEDLARNHPQAELEIARQTGRYEEEGWRLRKDGSRFWANIIITRLLDSKGKLIGFSKVTRDLSQKKEVEEKLRQSEQRFRLLVEGVKDYAIFMLDTEGRIASWNQGAARIKGYESSEIVGKHFSIFYTPDEVASGKCEYELREAALTGRFEDEGWRVRKDGSMLWASVVITAIRDRDRKLIGFTKVTRDLTERKRSEDRLQRAYSDLERRVNERTADLALANTELARRETELKEAVRVRDEFLSIASHELKTPITSLKMQLQILQAKSKPGQIESLTSERLGKSLDVSLRQVDRLTRLIEDLLDVARSQAQKLSFTFEQIDLQELVEEVVERYATQLEAARCRLEIIADETVVGNFDRFRLDQVLVNLITNAVKYAPGTKITISLKRVFNSAQLIVADEGPGMTEETRLRLFQRFERGSNSQNISGLGLGLFIAKQIVSGHRGSIRVESAPGQGTQFIIDLPLTLPAESRAQEVEA